MTLKPCPACGHKEPRLYAIAEYARCTNQDCQLEGPNGDPDGAKWNALPRAEDASALLAVAKGCHDYNGVCAAVVGAIVRRKSWANIS